MPLTVAAFVTTINLMFSICKVFLMRCWLCAIFVSFDAMTINDELVLKVVLTDFQWAVCTVIVTRNAFAN